MIISGQNGTITDVFLQSSTTVMSPTPKPVNKNTSLTTEPWNQTRSVNSTAATGLTSPASSRIGTTRNNMNVPSVDPKTDFQTTIATGVTGSKSPVTRPANSSKFGIRNFSIGYLLLHSFHVFFFND